jgi:hypothetical protein
MPSRTLASSLRYPDHCLYPTKAGSLLWNDGIPERADREYVPAFVADVENPRRDIDTSADGFGHEMTRVVDRFQPCLFDVRKIEPFEVADDALTCELMEKVSRHHGFRK